MTAWIYTDTSKQVGDPDRLKVFADQDAADERFKQHNARSAARDNDAAPAADR
jgi:hypothetical protein